jgi:hypothetical protein
MYYIPPWKEKQEMKEKERREPDETWGKKFRVNARVWFWQRGIRIVHMGHHHHRPKQTEAIKKKERGKRIEGATGPGIECTLMWTKKPRHLPSFLDNMIKPRRWYPKTTSKRCMGIFVGSWEEPSRVRRKYATSQERAEKKKRCQRHDMLQDS